MPRSSRLAIAAVVGGLLLAGRGRVARLVRTLDQRAGVFAPHGAGLYNAVAPMVLGPLYRRVADDLVTESRLAGLAESSSVLEIGSGPGELAVEIARRLPAATVVGIDLAPAMIDRSLDQARTTGLAERIRFELADAAALPLGDASFDVVVSTLSLHHWSDPATVFAEIGRVLRPGGLALIYDLRPVTYTRRELDAFLAGSPFEGARLERQPLGSGWLAVFFVRIRLVRPRTA